MRLVRFLVGLLGLKVDRKALQKTFEQTIRFGWNNRTETAEETMVFHLKLLHELIHLLFKISMHF